MRRESDLHEVSLYALYHHPSGFFARGEVNWFQQSNDTLMGVGLTPERDGTLTGERRARNSGRFINPGPPGDNFWPFNLFAGYRFYRNQCELHPCPLAPAAQNSFRTGAGSAGFRVHRPFGRTIRVGALFHLPTKQIESAAPSTVDHCRTAVRVHPRPPMTEAGPQPARAGVPSAIFLAVGPSLAGMSRSTDSPPNI